MADPAHSSTLLLTDPADPVLCLPREQGFRVRVARDDPDRAHELDVVGASRFEHSAPPTAHPKEKPVPQTLTPEVPFAARAAVLPNLVDLTILDAGYDPEQQLNTLPDGTPWHTTPMAASSTDTNADGQGDDVDDPYYASAS